MYGCAFLQLRRNEARVFGIHHGYQGIRGLISTTILALVFSALFFATGSLWLSMLVHALIDLRILVGPT